MKDERMAYQAEQMSYIPSWWISDALNSARIATFKVGWNTCRKGDPPEATGCVMESRGSHRLPLCENLGDPSIASNVCVSTELMMATSDTGLDTAIEVTP
jgi:hypothetical protein